MAMIKFSPGNCCCTTGTCETECCESGRWPDQINCDVGTLGWTDVECAICDTLGGVYVLNYDAGDSNPGVWCSWTYDSGVICTTNAYCVTNQQAYFTITARLYTDCEWRIEVGFSLIGGDDSCGSRRKIANYILADSDTEDCDCMEIPFDSINTNTDDVCDGDFPASIKLSRGAFDCPDPPGFALPAALAFMNLNNGFEFVAAGNAEFADVLSLT